MRQLARFERGDVGVDDEYDDDSTYQDSASFSSFTGDPSWMTASSGPTSSSSSSSSGPPSIPSSSTSSSSRSSTSSSGTSTYPGSSQQSSVYGLYNPIAHDGFYEMLQDTGPWQQGDAIPPGMAIGPYGLLPASPAQSVGTLSLSGSRVSSSQSSGTERSGAPPSSSSGSTRGTYASVRSTPSLRTPASTPPGTVRSLPFSPNATAYVPPDAPQILAPQDFRRLENSTNPRRRLALEDGQYDDDQGPDDNFWALPPSNDPALTPRRGAIVPYVPPPIIPLQQRSPALSPQMTQAPRTPAPPASVSSSSSLSSWAKWMRDNPTPAQNKREFRRARQANFDARYASPLGPRVGVVDYEGQQGSEDTSGSEYSAPRRRGRRGRGGAMPMWKSSPKWGAPPGMVGKFTLARGI